MQDYPANTGMQQIRCVERSAQHSLIKLAAATMPFMHLEDDFSLDELARALAARFKPAGLLYLSGALQAIAEQQLSGLTPEEHWLAQRGIVPSQGWKRD